MDLEQHIQQDHRPYDYEGGEDQLTFSKSFKYPKDTTLQERHTLYHLIRYWREYLSDGHDHRMELYKLQPRQKQAARAWLNQEFYAHVAFDRGRPEELEDTVCKPAIKKRLGWLDQL